MAQFSLNHGLRNLPGQDRNPNWVDPRRKWHAATSNKKTECNAGWQQFVAKIMDEGL